MENQESIYEEKQGNLLTGILGALLGALIGTALWVLVGVWGYIGHHDYRNADSVDLRRHGGNGNSNHGAKLQSADFGNEHV